jgi:uncharacterized protein YxjI
MARYKMRQRLLSIGEDYDIEDERGRRAFHVDGKVMRIRETFVLTDASGGEVATIREKKLSIRDTMSILRGGETLATIRKAWISPLRDKFIVEVRDAPDLEVKGDILDHEYEVRRGRDTVARISKRWFTLRDTYGIEVSEGEDDALLLAVAVAVDEMAHDPDEQGHG